MSISGTWMQRVAQNRLILELSDSGIALGISTALQFLPVLLFGMWGGVLVDRLDRRRLLLGTQAALALTLGGSTPIGGAVAGFVSEAWGARAGLAMGGVAAFLVGLPYARGLRESPGGPAKTPEVRSEAG